jgi:hypothetical protein
MLAFLIGLAMPQEVKAALNMGGRVMMQTGSSFITSMMTEIAR